MVAVKAFSALSDNGNITEIMLNDGTSFKLGVGGIMTMLYTSTPAGIAVYYHNQVVIVMLSKITSIACDRTYNSDTVNLDPDVSSLKFNM